MTCKICLARKLSQNPMRSEGAKAIGLSVDFGLEAQQIDTCWYHYCAVCARQGRAVITWNCAVDEASEAWEERGLRMLCCRGCRAESGVGGRGTPATQADMTARRVPPPIGGPTQAIHPGSKCSHDGHMPCMACETPLSLGTHSRVFHLCMAKRPSTSGKEARRARCRVGHGTREAWSHVGAIGLRDEEGGLLRGRPSGGPLGKAWANEVGRRLVVGEGLHKNKRCWR